LLGPPRGRADTAGLDGVAGCCRSLDAAGGEERGQAERARAGARGREHLAAGYPPLRQAAPDGRIDGRVQRLRLRVVLIVHHFLPMRPARTCEAVLSGAGLANWIRVLWLP